MLTKQIQEIIDKCGPRPAGSSAEEKAQLFLANRLSKITDQVAVEPFEAALTAKFSKMKLTATFFLLSMALFWFSPIAAFVLSFFNALVVVCDLMRNDGIADFLYPKTKSANVLATLEPQEAAKQTLIFSAHIDSTKECRWWYKWKQFGVYLTILCGVLIAISPVFFGGFLIAESYFRESLRCFDWAYAMMLLLSPSLLVYFSFHNELVVEGACDNLSGIVIAMNAFEKLADPLQRGKNILKDTRISFVSFGAEERGLRGSTAFVKLHKEQLQQSKNLLINVDSVRLPDQITLVTGEWMSGAAYNKKIIGDLEAIFKSKSHPYKKGNLPFGATDAVPFARIGVPAVTIIGMDMSKLDFTYHTRHDIVKNVDEEALNRVQQALIDFANML